MRNLRKTYTNCTKLPLSIFIQILINDDKELLYIDKKTAWNKPAPLESIWEAIFLEYTELSNDNRSINVLALMREISVLNGKLNIIQNIVMLLATQSDISKYQESINILRTYGFRYQFTQETLLKDLQVTVMGAKRLVLERDEIQAELDKLNKNDQEKATEKDFYVNLASLSKMVGFAINPKETTVMQYCSYLEIQRANSVENE